jgi:competence protein ComEA
MRRISLVRFLLVLVLPDLLAASAAGPEEQALPPGAAKDTVIKVCTACHGPARFRRLRLAAGNWSDTVDDMVDRGAQATPEQIEAIVAYLAANFGPESKVLVNSAPLEELKHVLGLTTEEASAIIAYRREHGPFRAWTDLLNVPGLDRKKIEAKKDTLAFS